jgi:hypothetical protein
MKLSPYEARQTLLACGCDLASDFHALPSSVVQCLIAQADLRKYRKPDNANGSRGRYFHAHLIRLASKD